MPATKGDLVKGAVVDLFTAAAAAAGPGDALHDVAVRYSYDGQAAVNTVYGGPWTFVQQDAVAERGVLRQEVVEVMFVVRVMATPVVTLVEPVPDPIRAADAQCSAIADGLLALLLAHPTLDGGIQWLDLARGRSDYAPFPPDQMVSQRSLTFQFGSMFSWGG